MSDIKYTPGQVEAATRQELGEVFGEGSPTVDVLTGRVLGRLVLDGVDVSAPSSAELTDFCKPPRYAERAINTNSPEELASLAGEACERLRRSIASYLNDNDQWNEHELLPSGVYRMHPWIFKEDGKGSEGDSIVGELFIRTDLFGNDSYPYGDRTVLSMKLKGGEDAPYSKFDDDKKGSAHSERLLEIREKTVHDPIAQADVKVMYATANAGYHDGSSSRGMFELYKGKEQDPHLVATVKADVFWALDMAITYYEEVYVTFNKHVGLGYADYRDAGCLDDKGYIDNDKARAYVLSQSDTTDERSAGWPELGDWDSRVVAMNTDIRAKVEAYRSRMGVRI